MHDAGDDATEAASPSAGGATWMTYREIAAVRGISHAAAIRLVQRRRWQKREGSNDGLAHVLVPHDALQSTPPVRHSPSRRVTTPPDTSLLAGALAALESAVFSLTARAEQAEAGRANERQRADEEQARADALRAKMDVLNAEMVEARAEADRAMADERMRADAAGRDKERAEADRDAERARADALRERIEALQEQLAAHQEGVDATEAIRQAEAMVDSLREAHAGEVGALKAERHRLATQIDGFAARADQAEERTDSLRARVDVLQRERDTARAEAEEAAAELRQADEERRARGLLARLRAALRGR